MASPSRYPLLTVEEVAERARLSDKAVRRAIADGELRALKLRSQLRVRAEDFERWLAAGKVEPVAPPARRRPRTVASVGAFRDFLHAVEGGRE